MSIYINTDTDHVMDIIKRSLVNNAQKVTDRGYCRGVQCCECFLNWCGLRSFGKHGYTDHCSDMSLQITDTGMEILRKFIAENG